ncbi:hypothetical protein [Nocardia sp. NPDC057668]|uniref:hypothetical protein n=1 Tax=Nocardia sp. NPDC057668 TaxID=3346202 RepID=UPI003671359B
MPPAGELVLIVRRLLGPLTIAALATAALPFTGATAQARGIAPDAAQACLWDGAPYRSGATVVAGGDSYRCGSQAGAPYWFRTAAPGATSTVANPGASGAPQGRFSAGARQPGTSYNDYCVGYQLIPGTDDVYQVVRLPDGRMFWKAAAPISQWPFAASGPDSVRPAETWRSTSSCNDGNMA